MCYNEKINVRGDIKMSKESRIFTPSLYSAQETITHYESFGWELLSINGNQIAMSRETQNPVYAELVKYQAKYEELEQDYKNVIAPIAPAQLEPVNIGAAIIGVLCFIIPGALYIAYRINKKKKYDAEMQEYHQAFAAYNSKRQMIPAEMKRTAEQSRAVFFSKQ